MAASLNPELTELSLEKLRLRRSAKWRFYDEDVLPAFVAEMDFPLAPPVKIALAEAVELNDTGYGYPDALGLKEAYADFAAARFDWQVDPAYRTPLDFTSLPFPSDGQPISLTPLARTVDQAA